MTPCSSFNSDAVAQARRHQAVEKQPAIGKTGRTWSPRHVRDGRCRGAQCRRPRTVDDRVSTSMRFRNPARERRAPVLQTRTPHSP